MGAKQRDGFEYEFTCSFLIDQKTNCAEAQKDNTHIFEHEGSTLLTENHGKKIIQWANLGEGYTPVRKEKEDTAADEETQLSAVKKEIINICQSVGGTKNEELMTMLKTFTKNGNPNAIKDLEKARECLAAIKDIKPIEEETEDE